MKVTLFDVDQPDRQVQGEYIVDTTMGAPAVGDEVCLRERDYNPDRFYFAGIVRRRRWLYSNNKPEIPELHLWIQQQKR